MPTDADPNGRVGFRDIYRAVGESEARVVAAIQAVAGPLSDRAADHESRLRSLEVDGPLLARANRVIIDRQEERLAYNSKVVDNFIAREQGIFSTLGAGKTTILTLAALVGPILAILALYSR